jgi:hypothetical protein
MSEATSGVAAADDTQKNQGDSLLLCGGISTPTTHNNNRFDNKPEEARRCEIPEEDATGLPGNTRTRCDFVPEPNATKSDLTRS